MDKRGFSSSEVLLDLSVDFAKLRGSQEEHRWLADEELDIAVADRVLRVGHGTTACSAPSFLSLL